MAASKYRQHADLLTYKHPRTMIEAFGCDVDNAVAIERYKPKGLIEGVLDVLTALAIAAGLAWLLVLHLSS